MQVSVNTAIFLEKLQAGMSQLACLKLLVDQPIDAVEVRGEFFESTTEDSELAAIDELCQQQGWSFYYSVPQELFTSAGVNTGLSQLLTMARRYHIKGLKYSSGELDAPELVLAQLRLLDFKDVQVTLENQPNDNGQLVKIKKLLDWVFEEQLPLGYTFDSGNWYWINQQPELAFEQLENEVTVFHLKDIADQTTVMLGQGATDWRRLVQVLPIAVPVFLEYAIEDEALAGQIKLVNDALDQRG